MKTLFFALTIILIQTSYGADSLCTGVFEKSIITISDCRYYNHGRENCEKIVDKNDSLTSLSRAHHLLKLGVVFQDGKNVPTIFEDNFQSKDIADLRGNDITKFLNRNHDVIYKEVFDFSFDFWRSYSPSYVGYEKSFYKDVVKFVDSNYRDYFMRYVKILHKEIPWEEVARIEKGLSFSELMMSLEDLSSNKCDFLLKRYGLRITWKDVAREGLDNHFKNLLKNLKKERQLTQ